MIDERDMSDITANLNRLLLDWRGRQRVLAAGEAAWPMHLRRIVAALDASGPSEAADCIHSLVFELTLARQIAVDVGRAAAAVAGRAAAAGAAWAAEPDVPGRTD